MTTQVELRRIGSIMAASKVLHARSTTDESEAAPSIGTDVQSMLAIALDAVASATSSYVARNCGGVSAAWSTLTAETQALGPVGVMQITHDQAQFLTMLVKLTRARRAIEIGTFTGASAMAIASGLPDDGRLICCDTNESWTTIAQRHWRNAGVDDKIDLRLGRADETLRGLPPDAQFDFAFIDADKGGYITYYEAIMKRMSSGGLIVADNVFLDGTVFDPTNNSELTTAIRAFNEHVARDPRVEATMLTVADGLLLVRVR